MQRCAVTLEALTFPDTSLDTVSEPGPGPIRTGSKEHKKLFCRMLLTTFDPYRPAVIDWPKLEPAALARLTGLPIWDVAVQTEGKAGLRVAAYGQEVTDVLLKKAITLNAFEERRHKHVLRHMVQAYGIRLKPEPEYAAPRDAEWAFIVTGYSECIDSFFAFGLFEIARRSGFFPAALVDTFEPVMREEGRHILFFVNWVAWHRRTMPRWRRPWFAVKIIAAWFFLIWERIGIAASNAGSEQQDNNFTVNGAKNFGITISIVELIDTCLAENDRRLGVYDERLLRPEFVPRVVRLARRCIRALTMSQA
jgi:hypothetical protein